MASIITAGTTTGTALSLTSDTSGELQIKTNNGSTTAMTLTTAGDVGIGVTSPDAGVHLRVFGNATYTAEFGTGNKARFFADATGAAVEAVGAIPINLYTNSLERMRITSAGNVGIGTSSPSGVTGSVVLDVYSATNGQVIVEGGSGANFLTLYSGTSSGDSPAMIFNQALRFGSATAKDATGFAERMRLETAGNLLLGTSTALSFFTMDHGGIESISIRNNTAIAGRRRRLTVDGNNTFYVLDENTNGVFLGQGSTSWGGLSDERHKNIIEPITNAVEKVSALRTVIGKYKTDEEGTRRSFLIAQDVQAVFPEAVDVQPNEEQTLGLRYTELIPLLTAAIQELKAELDSVKAELQTIKGQA
jgi:hypothetical protein